MRASSSPSCVGALAFAIGISGCAGADGSAEGRESDSNSPTETASALRVLEQSGDILVTLASEGSTVNGGILQRVGPDGRRSIISDFANPAQGPLGIQPFGVEVELSGKILVLDRKAGTEGVSAIFRVDPRTGFRSLVSDFGDPSQGPLGHNPEAFSLDARGTIIVAGENHADPASALLVYAVDPRTGERTIVSDFGNSEQGPLGVGLERAAAIPGDPDHLLVTDRDFGANQNGALFLVDRWTGQRRVVSDFGDLRQGPLALNPEGFVFEPEHTILLADENEAAGALFRVSYVTGKRSKLSSWNDSSEGPALEGVEGLGESADRQVLASAPEGGASEVGAIYRIDRETGVRSLLTDFGDPDQGPVGSSPLYASGFFPGSGQLRGAIPEPRHHDDREHP